MGTNSTPRPAGRKPTRPGKPRPDFPLYAHKVGRWAKKVRGRVVYFTRWSEDPKGKAALQQWLEQRDDLLAGREPRATKPDDLTVRDLVNQFLTHHEERRDNGEISPRTWQALHGSCANIVRVFGRGRAVLDLGPDDFGSLKTELGRTRGSVALRNEMQRCRSVFRYGYVNGLIDREVRYGSKFDKPPLKQVRRDRREHQQKHGARMFEAAEIRQILAEAGQPLRTMVWLAVCGGFGQSDLANLPVSAIDWESRIISFPRPKTEQDRVVPIWPEVVKSIREWLVVRPTKAKDRADNDLLFLTVRGAKWVKASPTTGAPKDCIQQEFVKVLARLGLRRPGCGFYALRHSHRTIADEALDPVAANLIMGHCDRSMSAHYRERVGIERLRRVSDHVRRWLLDDPDREHKKELPQICDPSDPAPPDPEKTEAKRGSKAGRKASGVDTATTPDDSAKNGSGVAGSQGSQTSHQSFNHRPKLRVVG